MAASEHSLGGRSVDDPRVSELVRIHGDRSVGQPPIVVGGVCESQSVKTIVLNLRSLTSFAVETHIGMNKHNI